MHMIAALADAPTAAIAVVAIALGLVFAARGPREKRAARGADGDGGGPAMVTLAPVSRSEAEGEPGFVGPQGEIVGHGPIRLGVHGPLGASEPEPQPAPEPVPAAVEAEPAPAPIDAPGAATTEATGAVAEQPGAAVPPPAEPEAAPPGAEPKEPAWRVAARAANSAVHFRQGTIKLGGRDAGQPKDQ
jgi:hypothetical protein